MKLQRKLSTVLIAGICICCLSSCNRFFYSFTGYPQGCILKGELDDGRTLYLLRENDSVNLMLGHALIYENQSIAHLVPYEINHFGVISYHPKNKLYTEKVRTHKKGFGLSLDLPHIPELGINKQKIDVKYWDLNEREAICPELFKPGKYDSITIQKDIQFGVANGYYTSQSIDTIKHGDNEAYLKLILRDIREATSKREELPLFMDIYKPYDTSGTPKPAFVFIHGGGFFFGDKSNLLQENLTTDLVSKGCAVISIDYRLGSVIFGVKSVEKLIYSGVQDVRAALRYIVHNSEELGIDPNQIYIGGSSAGAIIALHTAFMDEDEVFRSAERRRIRKELGPLNSSGNDLTDIFNIAGVVSMWGAVVDMNIIDQRNAHIPVIMFHGTADNIVPIDSGLPFQEKLDINAYNRISNRWRLYGSKSIHEHMRQQDMPAWFFAFEGYGHEPQVNPDGTYNQNMTVIEQQMNKFIYRSNEKTPHNYFITGPSNVYADQPVSTYTAKNANNTSIKWHVHNGLIVERQGENIQVVWFDTHTEGKVSACITDENGHAENVELHVSLHQKND